MSWFNRMSIGSKFLCLVLASSIPLTAVGWYWIAQQEREKVHMMLEARAKVIQAQIEVTRAYIAKHYVGKIQNSKAGATITVTADHATNPQAIPLPATATREMAEELGKRGLFTARLISATPLNPANAPKDPFEAEAIKAIMSGAESVSRFEEENGVPVFRRATPDRATATACLSCHTGKQLGDVVGVLSVSIPVANVQAASAASLTRTGLAMSAVILAALAATFVLLRLVVIKPLKAATALARELAEGQGDLTRRLPVSGRDELAELAQGVNGFLEQLEGMVRHVAQATDQVASAAVELSATAEEMAKGADRLTTRMTQTATAVEEMTATVGETAQHASQAAQVAQETVTTAQTGRQVVQETIAGMQKLAEVITQSAQRVTALGQSSEQIGAIVKVIEDIADQTNLLALNAAIEAARAGEQGRGFAVVADEVRKLAERTTQATQEIGAMIRQIQEATQGAVGAMEAGTQQVTGGVTLATRAGEALGAIAEQVTKTAELIRQMAVAAEQQSVATQQIAGDVETVATVSKETASGAAESAKASQDLRHLAAELQQLVGGFTVRAEATPARTR